MPQRRTRGTKKERCMAFKEKGESKFAIIVVGKQKVKSFGDERVGFGEGRKVDRGPAQGGEDRRGFDI